MKKPFASYYSLRSYLTYLSRFKRRMLVVFSCFTIADILLAIIPVFIGRLTGALAASPVAGHQAIIYVWLLIICSTAHDTMWHAGELTFMKLLNQTNFNYETLVFKHIIRKPYPYFVNKFTGKVSSYISTMTQDLGDFTEKIFWNYISAIVSLTALVIIMLSVNWQSGVIFSAGVVLMIIVGSKTIKNSAYYEQRLADVRSDKEAKIIDAIANFVNVKAFHKEATEIKTIQQEQDLTIKTAKQAFVWDVVFWGSMGMIVRNVIWPASIGLNVYLFLHHELSIAELTTFLSAVLLFSTTIWEVIEHISEFNLMLARLEEAHKYLFGPVNIMREQPALPAAPKLQFKQAVSLQQLSFAYPDNSDEPVLNNISLELRPGEKLGIVGKSGSGKSTLTKLLLGYYPVTDGQLLLDDQTISSTDIARLISYVPQDTSLFHRSVADNIAYAADHAVDRQQIIAAAKQAHADEFITKIDEGYNALVGERGVKLSAGQRQRIAIARAFLDDKPLLILDEATSALDSESEVLVQEALEALWEQKTVIAIAHRLSTLRHMDSIIVMDNGQIVERGSHTELLKQKGKYAKLWNHQSGGFIEDGDD